MFYGAALTSTSQTVLLCLLLTRNEYLIFQKIIKLEYEFPEKFFPKAKDLVEQLLVGLVFINILKVIRAL